MGEPNAPLSTPEDAVAFERGQQKVRDINGRPLCDWHTDRAKEMMGLSDQIGRQTGLVDENVPHTHDESAPYRGQCQACAFAQIKGEGRPWEVPAGGGFRPSPRSERTPSANAWPNRPRRTGPFTPLPYSTSAINDAGVQMQRVAVRRSQGSLRVNEGGAQKLAYLISADLPDVVGLTKLAHDSGDGQTIFHCPFCFTENTRFITEGGVKTFGETVGTVQRVLTADRDQRTSGRWVDAHIHEFGEQSIMRVTLRRNKRRKVVEATPAHRWLVKSMRRVAGAPSRSTDYDVLTKDLRPGHRLSYLRPEGVGELVPDHDGIRHGVVFGDGSAQGRSASVSLWGEKDKQLLDYFPNRRYSERRTPNGVRGVYVSGDLWAWMKAIPENAESDEYLYGWLAGYFAADGTVSKQGQVQINSATLEHLEAVRDIATQLGITTYGINTKMRKGFPGREPSPLHTLEFVSSTLNEHFFLIEQHRDRYQLRDYRYERIGWTVESVEMTDRVEKVYCAVVPGTHSFALEDNVWVGNCGSGQVIATSDGGVECEFCHASFTVQVQPQYPAFPQTMDGGPVQVPGMGPDFTQYGGTPPGEEAPVPMDGEEGDEDDPNGGDPMGTNADETEPPEEDDDEDEDSGGGGNPFAKKSYHTIRGATLDYDSYLKHLALAHTHQVNETLRKVRASNGVR